MSLKDLFFPRLCLNCGFLGAYVCTACEKKLVYQNNDSCVYCGKRSYQGFTHEGCKKKRGVDGCVSIFVYNSILQKILKHIKYRFVQDALGEIFRVIKVEALYKLLFFKTYMIPLFFQAIPLHPNRLKTRGFNQSDRIVLFLRHFLDASCIDVLERKKDTKPQAQIQKREERFTNIRGSFTLKKKVDIQGKTIMLVDDVVTTGETVKEAARILKKGGAYRVYVFTLAKG